VVGERKVEPGSADLDRYAGLSDGGERCVLERAGILGSSVPPALEQVGMSARSEEAALGRLTPRSAAQSVAADEPPTAHERFESVRDDGRF